MNVQKIFVKTMPRAQMKWATTRVIVPVGSTERIARVISTNVLKLAYHVCMAEAALI